MNTDMWNNNNTKKAINNLKKEGYLFIDPEVKVLACGVKGIGALANTRSIVNFVKELSKDSVLKDEACK